MPIKLTQKHLEFCKTELQEEAVTMYLAGHTLKSIAKKQNRDYKRVHTSLRSIETRAAKEGVAPDYDLVHQTAPGFATKRVSTAYGEDGNVKLQWHIQEPEKVAITEMVHEVVEGFVEKLQGKHSPRKFKNSVEEDLLCAYIIGDHHLGMLAHSDETLGDDYDVKISKRLLQTATERLISVAPKSQVGLLLNLGDFLHINDSTSTTPASKHLLDSDGRYGKTIREASILIRDMIMLMLEKHEQVWVINVRGNHDPDASLWLNEVMRLFFESDPRVQVFDNLSKFIWFQWGKNLVVTHHGDKIKMANLYGSITRNLRKEWGESKHTFVWTGHVHHKNQEEYGGAIFESFNILAPPDAWHAGSGYSSSRSMSCIVLHKDFGEEGRLKVNIERLENDSV
jgi:hypothetical protein